MVFLVSEFSFAWFEFLRPAEGRKRKRRGRVREWMRARGRGMRKGPRRKQFSVDNAAKNLVRARAKCLWTETEKVDNGSLKQWRRVVCACWSVVADHKASLEVINSGYLPTEACVIIQAICSTEILMRIYRERVIPLIVYIATLTDLMIIPTILCLFCLGWLKSRSLDWYASSYNNDPSHDHRDCVRHLGSRRSIRSMAEGTRC